MTTKEDLQRQVAQLTAEIEALRDIFVAINDAGETGVHSSAWIVGYAGGIGTSQQHHGNVPLLHAYAAHIRQPEQEDAAFGDGDA